MFRLPLTPEQLQELKHSSASAQRFLTSRRIRGWPTIQFDRTSPTAPLRIFLIVK